MLRCNYIKIILGCALALVFSFHAFSGQSNIPLTVAQYPVFQQILDIYNNKSGQEWAQSMSQLLDPNVVSLSWSGQQTDTLNGREKIISYLNEQSTTYHKLQKNVGRFMIAGGGVGGGPDPYGSVLVLFYEASTHPAHQKPWVWSGCDIITIAHGKIVDWRVQEDTYMKKVKHPEKIHMEREYAIIDKFWRPVTTTNDKVGMAYLLDLKRTVMPTASRGKLLLKRMSPATEQSTWEPQDILYLNGLAEIKPLFF